MITRVAIIAITVAITMAAAVILAFVLLIIAGTASLKVLVPGCPLPAPGPRIP